MKQYIAVIKTDKLTSKRTDGTWSAVTDKSKDVAIQKALNLKDQYEKGGYGPYKVFAGLLTEVVVPNRVYKVKKI